MLFWVCSPLFVAVGAPSPAELGLSPVVYKWSLILLGVGVGVFGKLGASWLKKTDDGMTVSPSTAAKIAPLLLLVLFLPIGPVGCAPKNVTYETPAAHVMFDANEVLKRVGEVEDATFDLQAKGTMSLNDARIVIQGCRVLDIALPAAASGWQNAAVTAAWEAARTEIPELGEIPTTWQAGAKKVWAAVKLRVPAITTNQVYAIAARAIDGAILKL